MTAPAAPSTGKPTEGAVDEAEERIGAVLEDLEADTDAEVQRIGLEDIVDTDPASGRPVIRKAVDIDVRKRSPRSWLR